MAPHKGVTLLHQSMSVVSFFRASICSLKVLASPRRSASMRNGARFSSA